MEQQLITQDQALQILGISKYIMSRLEESGAITAAEKLGPPHHTMFRLRDVLKLLRERIEVATEELADMEARLDEWETATP